MEAYTGFAQVYDTFMDNVPYDEWVEYLHGLLAEHGVNDGLILELGCGTGNVTRRLRDLGYDMIGLDSSAEMLELAREKEVFENDTLKSPILYINQDMREFELYGTVGAVVSICDSMNYITKREDLLETFKLVNNYLDPEGVFIFDLNTHYKYKNILSNNVFAEDREDCSFIWTNYYDKDEKINEYDISLFVRIDNEEEIFERFREVHYQKAYEIEEIIDLIEEAGMDFVAVYDAFTHNPPTDTSERVYFVAREKYQPGKSYIDNH
ncbi:MAG: class I SAM-dependent methyltransferase [Clostridiales bacterium]|nr:class I SAM-dependent methyltransferase [Clostridiales bacterium]